MYDISIIIPAYNEGHKIRDDIRAACDFLTGRGLLGEIIVVDDGSKDATSLSADQYVVPESVHKRVIRYVKNRGKGHAVRTGVEAARGEVIMFIDSGLCFEYDNILTGYQWIAEGQCDMAHGSRWLKESNVVAHQPLIRRIASKIFHWLVFRLMKVPPHLTDTQCGVKLFRKEAAKNLFSRSKIDGYTFDLEIILRGIQQEYLMKEFPVYCRHDLDSRQPTTFGCWRVFWELFLIKHNLSAEADLGSRQLVQQ